MSEAVWLLQETDYDTRSVLGAFSTEAAALEAREELIARGDPEQTGNLKIVAIPLNPTPSELPAGWLVRLSATGQLLTSPDWFQYDVAWMQGVDGPTSGGWKGGYQAFGFTAEAAVQKARHALGLPNDPAMPEPWKLKGPLKARRLDTDSYVVVMDHGPANWPRYVDADGKGYSTEELEFLDTPPNGEAI